LRELALHERISAGGGHGPVRGRPRPLGRDFGSGNTRQVSSETKRDKTARPHPGLLSRGEGTAAVPEGQLERFIKVVRDDHCHLWLDEIEFGRLMKELLTYVVSG
jgi:hypothetical protein